MTPRARVTRLYRFSASHRLHAPGLSPEENARVFGKCNNPYGHGHDYVLHVTAEGVVNPATGLVLTHAVLDRLVEEKILPHMRDRNLNDMPEFAFAVATTENLAEAIGARLLRQWPAAFGSHGPRLERVRVEETKRNVVETSPLGSASGGDGRQSERA